MSDAATLETKVVGSEASQIHEMKLSGCKVRVSSGYFAIHPNGHLVKLPPNTRLKPGWSLATQADIDAATAKRQALDEAGESEARGRLEQAAASKRAAIEAAGETLTMPDDELAAAHERGDIKHPWPVAPEAPEAKTRGRRSDR